jgi:sortase A
MATRRHVLTAPSDAWGPLPPHAAHRPARPPLLLWLERVLLIVGFVGIGFYASAQLEAFLYQRLENRELDAILASRDTAGLASRDSAATKDAAAAAPARSRVRPATGSMLGRIEIPRLGVSAVVRAGSDARTLHLAVGHIPGTALPGEEGNVGLAGHRDTFFKRLRDIDTGDIIRVVMPDGVFEYAVERTTIVMPADVWVLDPTAEPALTLVTCYPFNYVGSAPQRFIVRAVQTR